MIDISSLDNGLYIIECFIYNQKTTNKFVKY